MHVVGTAGHVDHGKSTLVTALTGIDPDRFEEEKRRGLTIDLGFAWLRLPSGIEIGIVDVPGHERFIRNMLAGVGSIDAALFVVASDEGWMPQSAEHLQILDFLGVRRGVVVITKADLVDGEMLALVEEDLRRRLGRTSLAEAPVVAVSARTGSGLDDLLTELDAVLGESGPPVDRGRPRLFVDRSFTIAGAGTVVTGTLTGGKLRVGEEITILPDGRTARIRSLQTHRETVEEAEASSRVAANLVGLDRREVGRGDVVVRERWVLSRRFAALLRPVPDLGRELAERGAYELFVGAAQTRCRLRLLEPDRDPIAEVFTDHQLPVVPGDRFVVRDVGRWDTVAGGVVLDQSPPRLRRRDPHALSRLRARAGLNTADLTALILAERGLVGRDELLALAGAGEDVLDEIPADLASDVVIAPGQRRVLLGKIEDAVDSHHASHPLSAGLPVADLRRLLGVDAELLGDLVGRLQRSGAVVREGAAVRRPDHGSALAPGERAAADRALETLRAAGVSPPTLAQLGISVELARALERAGELVLLSPQLVYRSDTWQDIERRVVDLIASRGPATVADVRNAIGTTRKFAVPLLERLDATGLTRRRGDVRELGPRGRELAGAEGA